MSPEYALPYVKAQKTKEQLDLQSLHRVRSRLVTARTTLTTPQCWRSGARS
jgi:hypothetical protein